MPKITPTKTGFKIQHTTREVWGVDDNDAADAAAEERTRIGNTPTELLDPESDEAEALLDAAKEAQTAFWNALHDLEEALGVEIESTQDLQGMTCTDLTSDEDEMEQERRTR